MDRFTACHSQTHFSHRLHTFPSRLQFHRPIALLPAAQRLPVRRRTCFSPPANAGRRSLSIPSEKLMCLGIPGKVVETYREHDVLMGKIDFGGVFKRACLEHVPTAKSGD